MQNKLISTRIIAALDKNSKLNNDNKILKKIKFDTILNEINNDFYNNYNNSFNTNNNFNISKYSKNYKTRKVIKKENILIKDNIKNLDDLIKLIDKYDIADNIEYNIDMISLHKIKSDLIKLNSMVGMTDLKTNILDQILYFIQNLYDFTSEGDFMHTVIYGPPGTGKTEIAKIIGSIFCKIGILQTGNFKKVTRSDLIAGYLGQTALKTRDVVKESLGGVLFIDEAYALGNSEKRDSFSKECIDTLCESLSNYKKNLMVIVAGYENELKECFFSYNPGLESRFVWRFMTTDYTAEQLMLIFFKKVKQANWYISENSDITVSWFENNLSMFKHYGRSMENLFTKTKIAHSRRIFNKSSKHKKNIILEDLEKGFELYNLSQYTEKDDKKIHSLMYM